MQDLPLIFHYLKYPMNLQTMKYLKYQMVSQLHAIIDIISYILILIFLSITMDILKKLVYYVLLNVLVNVEYLKYNEQSINNSKY